DRAPVLGAPRRRGTGRARAPLWRHRPSPAGVPRPTTALIIGSVRIRPVLAAFRNEPTIMAAGDLGAAGQLGGGGGRGDRRRRGRAAAPRLGRRGRLGGRRGGRGRGGDERVLHDLA